MIARAARDGWPATYNLDAPLGGGLGRGRGLLIQALTANRKQSDSLKVMVLLIPQDMPRCRRAPRIRRECTRHPDEWSVSLRETGVEGAQPEQRSVESRSKVRAFRSGLDR